MTQSNHLQPLPSNTTLQEKWHSQTWRTDARSAEQTVAKRSHRPAASQTGSSGWPCWHFLLTGSRAGLLMSRRCPLYVHCGRLTQEGRCRQDLDSSSNICALPVKADVFGVQPPSVTLRGAGQFGPVCHLLSGGNRLAEIFMLECLHSVKLRGFVSCLLQPLWVNWADLWLIPVQVLEQYIKISM